ncbi:unnamed protein product [Rotaria socialis]
MNSNTLYVAIEELVNKSQKYLREEFKYKEMMLKFDVNDHRLITKVYNLKPNEKQIAWMKEYWKQTAAELQALEEVEILRKRTSLQRLSPSFDNHVNQSIVPLQTMLSRSIINNEQRAILSSRCSKTAIQYNSDVDHQQRRQRAHRSNLNIYTRITASFPFIHTDLNLSSVQMSMLIKGIKYIIPCQSRFSKTSIDNIVKQQYTSISRTVQRCLDDHDVIARELADKEAFPTSNHLLRELQSTVLPRKLSIRSRRERKIVKSIRQILSTRSDVIIRRTDKPKVLFLGNALEFSNKALEYMIKMEAYQELTRDHCPLYDILNVVTSLLSLLLKHRVINQCQHKRMNPNRDTLELAHLYFIPKSHKPDYSLRSIVAAIHAPTTMMSQYLNDLLAPIYLQVARNTTVINDIDLIRNLEQYVSDGRLKLNTLFITFDVKNLYTMIPRQYGLEVFRRFLERHLKRSKIGTSSIDDLMKMESLVLDNNYFMYQGKYYQQIRGGAMESAFTQTFANIYIYIYIYIYICLNGNKN